MDVETINIIKSLLEENSIKEASDITAAYLTVGGMLGVAVLGTISQWFISKRILTKEHQHRERQLKSEFEEKRQEKWESDILEAITDLLTVTDPDINEIIDQAIVTKHVTRVQLLLNTDDLLQKKVDILAAQLALTVNGMNGEKTKIQILEMHGQLTYASNKLLYRSK